MEQFTKWEKPTAAVSSQNPQLTLEWHKSIANTGIIGYYCSEMGTHTPISSDPQACAANFAIFASDVQS